MAGVFAERAKKSKPKNILSYYKGSALQLVFRTIFFKCFPLRDMCPITFQALDGKRGDKAINLIKLISSLHRHTKGVRLKCLVILPSHYCQLRH